MRALTDGDDFDPQSLLQTVEGAARALRLGKTRIFELIKSKQLERIKIGHSTRITTASIVAYVNSQTEVA
jgi:excisionase family DNA binding protein